MKQYIVINADNSISVTTLREHTADEEERLLAKALFEMSRNSGNMDEHFNADVHTLEALKNGIDGHTAIDYKECEHTDLPSDRYFRDAWEWND